MKRSILIFSIIIVIIISVITFFYINNNKTENIPTLKTEEEIEHLQERIISMMNSLNNITLSNAVLVEEKTENKNENKQEGQNQEQSGNSSSNQSEKESSQNQESGSSNKSNTQASPPNETTKYRIQNDSILVNENNSIDWEYIKTNAEAIHSSWSIATIDLHSLNVNNEDILNFGVTLDQMTISAKQEDKTATLNNLASLYGFFPKYVEQISEDKEKINLCYTKTCVLNSYALMEQDKWDEMKVQCTNAINYFTNILNNMNQNTQNQNKVSKIYVLLNELNNSINLKDKEIFMIKYRNVMEELVNFK